MTRQSSPFTPFLLFLLFLLGCGSRSRNEPVDRSPSVSPAVVATTPMLGDLVRAIAGNDATVTTLLKEGVDPHTHQANAAEIRALTNADLIFFNGLKLEAMERDLEKLANKRPGRVVSVGNTVPPDRLRNPPNFEGHPDPHIWMDVSLWAETVPSIVKGLKDVVPGAADRIDERSQTLRDRLGLLDRYVREAVSTIPKEKRILITAHDAFGYFSNAYGIEVESVQGVTTESEAGVKDIQRLVELIAANDIPTVFVETSVSKRNISAVIEGAQALGKPVEIGGELFSDSSGAPGTWEGTYFGMLDHNVNTIVVGLGGIIPEGGFRAFEKAQSNPSVETSEGSGVTN